MKKTPPEICESHNQKATNTPLPSTAARSNRRQDGFVASRGEVARKAYFAYVNQGSQPGNDVRHWLEAEAQLLAEHDRN